MTDVNTMKVFAVCGSTRTHSANLRLLQAIAKLAAAEMETEIYNDLAQLPHFNPDLDKENDEAPAVVQWLRNKIKEADGVLICTPEYVFSLPGSLKNFIEWMVSTTVFSEKPVAFITASASGVKAHADLQLIMKTIYADLHRNRNY
ncbi:MAG: NADPH-dependent FMN reductase [Flavisolibacter sp.]